MLDRFLVKSAGRGKGLYCRTVLSFGASPDAKDSASGYYALHVASAKGHVSIVDMLLARGADVALVDASGCTALHRSVYWRRSEVTDRLLEREDLPLNTKALSGLSALHSVCLRGDVPIIQKLLSKGASIAIPDKFGRTPFHYAAMKFGEDVLQLFVDRGANINDVDDNGFSVLHFAVAGGNIEAVRYLVARDEINTSAKTTANSRVCDVFIPQGIGLLTEVTLLSEVLPADIVMELRKVFTSLGIVEDDLQAISKAQAMAIFTQPSTPSIFANESVMRFALETTPRQEFHDHFVNIFRNQMQLWHLVHAGLIPIQDKSGSAMDVLGSLVSSCPIPGLSVLMGGITAVHQMQRLSDWDKVAGQRFLMLSDPLTAARRLGAMILNLYAPVLDAMPEGKSRTTSEKPIIKALMKVVPKDKLSMAERFAVELNGLLIDHKSARRLLDDIALPKQLFAIVAVNMRDLLRDFIPLDPGSPGDLIVDSLARGFRGTETSGDALRRAFKKMARKHAQLEEFATESRQFSSTASLDPSSAGLDSHVDRVRRGGGMLAAGAASSGEFSLGDSSGDLEAGMLP